jgi:glycerol-3-phosphate dehydrogenase
VRLYGTNAGVLLGDAKSPAELGRNFGADLYEAEVRYLVDHEWAVTSEDVLWRRTKRGLKLSQKEAAALDEFMKGLSRRESAAAE